MSIRNLTRNILISVVIGIAVYSGLALWAGFGEITGELASFRWEVLPVVVSLSILNYAIRYVKWQYYLNQLRVKVKKSDSAYVFFSGLAFSVTPFKSGEVIKSFFLKQVCGEAMCQTAPIVLAERLIDLLSVIILAGIGAVSYRYGVLAIVVPLGLVVAFLVLVQSRRLSLQVIGLSRRLPVLRRFSANLVTLYESSFQLLQLRPTLLTTAISAMAWFCECLGAWLVIRGFGADISLLQATFIYAFSSIMGAVLFLPGGLGVAEASIIGLLVLFGVEGSLAVSSTLIIRLCTLWLAVLLGVVTLSLSVRRFDTVARRTIQGAEGHREVHKPIG